MMKRSLIAVFIAALQLFSLLPVSAAANGQVNGTEDIIDVIVELDCPEDRDAFEYALDCAKHAEAVLGKLEYGYIYDTIFCGFHAEVPESDIPLLEALGFVEAVYHAAEYEMLSYTDVETAMLPAAMIGFDGAERFGLTGNGIKVAVIDNGFDITHPAFDVEVSNTLEPEKYGEKMDGGYLNAKSGVSDVRELYHSTKIPFKYDYDGRDTDVFNGSSDHGTHVAGIIGAAPTESSSMRGYAPGCQLLLMKIFDDQSRTAGDQMLIAALDDAIKLGANVINLSIGHYAGSVDADRVLGLNRLIARAEEKGVMVICASGNDSVVTRYSAAARDDGIVYPLASYTDYGTLSSPASSDHTVAVASVNNEVYYGSFLRHAENRELYAVYTDTNVAGGVIPVPFAEHFDKRIIEYAVIPGIGEDKDYEGIDVGGKLVLVKRGTIPFVDKANIAASHGAVGIIVYNNVQNEYINMELTGAAIPGVAISLEDGERLIAEAVHRMVFDSNIVAIAHPDGGAKPASTSSYGTTPSLTLKPDIAGVGGSVYSTLNGGGYGGISGTSMASPQISGICALLIERSVLMGETDMAAAAASIKTAILNTAIPVIQSNGVEYSPRAQGAGLVNLSAAIEHEIQLVYTKNGKAKVELGDGLAESVSFDVTVKNLTDKKLSAKLGVSLSSDDYKEITYKEKQEYFSTLTSKADTVSEIKIGDSGNVNRHSAEYSPYIVELDGGESRTVTITVDFDAEYHGKLSEIFTNGHYAEGYIYCETANSSVSIPYLGYVGDFGAGSVLDGSIYEDETVLFKGTRFFIPIEDVFISAGGNIFSEDIVYDREKIAFSPDGDHIADELYFSTSFLRNTKSSKMTVSDSKGDTVYTLNMNYIQKTADVDETSVFRYIWDGGDGVYSGYILDDGRYTVTLEFVLDDGKDTRQTYSYPVIVDSIAPLAENITLDNGVLKIRAVDENGIYTVRIYEGDAEHAYSKRAETSAAEFDITDYRGERLYYELVDWAYNTTVGIIELGEFEGQGGTK